MSGVNHLFVIILAIVNALGGTVQFIALNWWIASFNSDTRSSYPILIISSAVYVIVFGVGLTYVWFRYYRGRIPITSLCGFPRSPGDFFSSPFWTLICIGFNDALNGVLAITAAPPDRTPPILGTILGGATIIYSLLLSKFYLGETKEFGRDAYIAALLVLSSIYISIMPFIQGGLESDDTAHQVYFWCAFTLAVFIPGTLYNAQQKKFVMQQERVVGRMQGVLEEHDSLALQDSASAYWSQVHFNLFTLFVGCVWQLIFMFAFFWIMLINVPSLNWNGTTQAGLHQQVIDGFGCFFAGGVNTLYGILFNIGYIACYCASIHLNLINLPLSMISGQMQGPLAAVTFLVMPSLDQNPTGRYAYSIIPSLVLMIAALFLYELWRKEHEQKTLEKDIQIDREGSRQGSQERMDRHSFRLRIYT